VSGRRLYIGRVPPDAVKRDLEDHFAGHGRLVDIRLMNGFAFVEYDRLSVSCCILLSHIFSSNVCFAPFSDPIVWFFQDAEQAVQDLGSKDFMGERFVPFHSPAWKIDIN